MGPRLRQTLELLLHGDGEKQIAGKLKLSQHTVHGYVKEVYRRFGVNSRAELLALWVKR
jgi:DNA-binding CsgD family transcriptional regulator